MLEDDLGSIGAGDTAISCDEGMILGEYFLAVETTVATFAVDDLFSSTQHEGVHGGLNRCGSHLFSRMQHEGGLEGLAAIVVNAGGQFVAAWAGMGRDEDGEEDDALL